MVKSTPSRILAAETNNTLAAWYRNDGLVILWGTTRAYSSFRIQVKKAVTTSCL